MYWGKPKKYKTFPISIKKEIILLDVETISYKIKFIDSSRFMANSLSNLVDSLTEGIHKM